MTFNFEDLDKVASGLVKAFINKNKTKIIFMLDKKDKMSISEIQRELNISYKETYRHVSDLIKAGVLEKKHEIKQKHQPVYVSLKVKFPNTSNN